MPTKAKPTTYVKTDSYASVFQTLIICTENKMSGIFLHVVGYLSFRENAQSCLRRVMDSHKKRWRVSVNCAGGKLPLNNNYEWQILVAVIVHFRTRFDKHLARDSFPPVTAPDE